MKIKIRKADQEFSRWLRKERKWTCERCFKREEEGMQVSHFYGRAAESVRFSEFNCDVLCFFCHNFFTMNPLEYVTWKTKKLGEKKMKELTLAWSIPQKRDDKLVLLWLKEKKNKSNYD